ncbi:hypothetical protein BX666DRAFT_1995033, partial [Dichotomocladium elegans]
MHFPMLMFTQYFYMSFPVYDFYFYIVVHHKDPIQITVFMNHIVILSLQLPPNLTNIIILGMHG